MHVESTKFADPADYSLSRLSVSKMELGTGVAQTRCANMKTRAKASEHSSNC